MDNFNIQKRDGRIVPFDISKIINAISKAFNQSGETSNITPIRLAEDVLSIIKKDNIKMPSVEYIQDIVEKVLIKNNLPSVAKEYILYRSERTKIRDMKSDLMKIYKGIALVDSKDNDTKRENANIDGDGAMGKMLKFGSEGSKNFYTMFIMDKKSADAHKNGSIHVHDLDFGSTGTTTCCQIDLISLFKNGFSTGHGHIRDPKNITSYSALAAIAIQSNQNDQHGGQSIPNFDYAMADGVRKSFVILYRKGIYEALSLFNNIDLYEADDKVKNYMEYIEKEYGQTPTLEYNEKYAEVEASILRDLSLDEDTVKKVQKFAYDKAVKDIDRETYQAMESFIHNLNTMHSRAGAQVPFSSINYGLDTSPEGRLVIKNLLLTTEAGLGNGETPIFPVQIFRIKEGINFNKEDPSYDLFKLAIRCSAKRLFPNFSFQDAPYNLQYYKEGHPETEISYMGCRTRVIGNVYDPSRQITFGRGNLSFTSINLPRLGIEAHGDIDKFFETLDEMMDLCIFQLTERLKFQSKMKVKNFQFLMGQGVWIDSDKLTSGDDTLEEVLKHGTLSVGFIGLAETLKVLTGKHHGESKESQELGLKIISHMRERLDEESRKTHLNYTLLATPAEGLSSRFVNIDKEKYGIIEGVTDKEYYTNSFHVPVYYNITAADKINTEAPYHALCNAGHISYIELDGDTSENLDAFECIIRYMKKCGIGYGAINHPVDRDPVCGFNGIIKDQCPYCGRVHKSDDTSPDFERIRRITGYLVGTLDRFNDGKRAEERDRVKHSTK